MEISFFRAGMTRTASDQSISMGAASGSFSTALAISSSVSLSTRAQSVLPFRRSPHFRVTIFSFFIFPRAAALLGEILTRASGRPIRMTRVRGTQSQSRRRPFSHILLYLRSHRLVPLGCAQLRLRFVYTIVFQMSTLQKLVFPVNSREKANNSRISPRHPYIDDRLAPAPDSPKIPQMRFTPQFLDEQRARLPVSEVVGKRVKLKKAGREWKGRQPCHK